MNQYFEELEENCPSCEGCEGCGETEQGCSEEGDDKCSQDCNCGC